MAKPKKLTGKYLDELERRVKAKTGTVESMVIGLVDRHLNPSRIVQMVGRQVMDVDKVPQILMPEIFGDFLYPAMIKVARGGRGSAKTQSFIRIILARMQASRTHVGCFREIQKSIADSIKQTIETIIEDIGLRDQFYITDKEISHMATGSKMVFAGLYRNVTSVKGMDWIDIAFCEEAENISEASWNVLVPTLRKDGAELMVCYNPKNVLDATHMRYGPGACKAYTDETRVKRYAITKQINYTDNPFFTETSRMQMEAMKEEDEELYNHIWLGMPNADSEQAIIKPSWIQSAVDAHIALEFEPEGARKVGQDVADEGKDTSALCFTHGSVVLDMDEWKKGDTDFTATKAYHYATENGADMLVYDSIGVGAGVKATLNRLRVAEEENGYVEGFAIYGFNAGGGVVHPDHNYMVGKTNGDMFHNIKAQAWWNLRDRFYKTHRAIHDGAVYDPSELISLSSDLPHLDKLMAELSRPRVDYGDTGKVKVESKKDMAKRQIPSPNLADALVMCFAPVAPQVMGILV
jgi:phage terminase large subunit